MNTIVRRNFVHCPFPTERFQDHLCFELPTMLPPLHSHRCLLPNALTHLTYSVVHFWGYIITSAYTKEIADALAQGVTPVFVELVEELGLDPSRYLVVDHHGERAGDNQRTSLQQVFEMLRLPLERWTRWFELVAANDRGYIPALVAMGATREEIVEVRAADPAAQGITPEEEAAGEHAITHAKTIANGRLTVVHLCHSHTATVTDRLQPELGGKGYKNLLVYCPEQINFFGTGTLVLSLHEKFPGGWHGGALPTRGFWGHDAPVPDVLPVLLGSLGQGDLQRIRENKDNANLGRAHHD